MKKKTLLVIPVLVILIIALAFPAGAATGMSVMGGFSSGNSYAGKAAALSDAKSLVSGMKIPALSSYSFMPKPDLKVYAQDTKIYSDPEQLAAWNKEAMDIPASQSGYFGLFVPHWGSSCGCG